jgi:NDP-sugar pyrophosphorylase family protein
VVNIREKPTHSSLVNAGLYVIEKDIISTLKPNEYIDMTGIIDTALANDDTVIPFLIHETWLDIGTPIDFEKANSIAHIFSD